MPGEEKGGREGWRREGGVKEEGVRVAINCVWSIAWLM